MTFLGWKDAIVEPLIKEVLPANPHIRSRAHSQILTPQNETHWVIYMTYNSAPVWSLLTPNVSVEPSSNNKNNNNNNNEDDDQALEKFMFHDFGVGETAEAKARNVVQSMKEFLFNIKSRKDSLVFQYWQVVMRRKIKLESDYENFIQSWGSFASLVRWWYPSVQDYLAYISSTQGTTGATVHDPSDNLETELFERLRQASQTTHLQEPPLYLDLVVPGWPQEVVLSISLILFLLFAWVTRSTPAREVLNLRLNRQIRTDDMQHQAHSHLSIPSPTSSTRASAQANHPQLDDNDDEFEGRLIRYNVLGAVLMEKSFELDDIISVKELTFKKILFSRKQAPMTTATTTTSAFGTHSSQYPPESFKAASTSANPATSTFNSATAPATTAPATTASPLPTRTTTVANETEYHYGVVMLLRNIEGLFDRAADDEGVSLFDSQTDEGKAEDGGEDERLQVIPLMCGHQVDAILRPAVTATVEDINEFVRESRRLKYLCGVDAPTDRMKWGGVGWDGIDMLDMLWLGVDLILIS